MSFDDALREHLAAIEARDVELLASTISERTLVLVTAKGEVSTEPAHFLALHRDWFASPTWSLETRLLHVHRGLDLATCVLELRYRDEPAVDERSIVTLVFALENERWVLVQDQNTPCRT